MPIVDYTLPTWVPKLSLGPGIDSGRVLYGREAEQFFSPQEFTLDAPTLHNKKHTEYEELVRYYEAYIAEQIHKTLHYKENRPKYLSHWKCPTNDIRIDLKGEAEGIFGRSFPCEAELNIHEVFPYNELSSTGTAYSMVRVVQNLKLDVVKIMDDLTTKKDDGSMHIICGDLATIEGRSLYHDFVC